VSGARPTVTIVGAGYAGVELAGTVQERLGSRAQVQIISSGERILPVRFWSAPASVLCPIAIVPIVALPAACCLLQHPCGCVLFRSC
jgi:NADPH-dependent 2,4-dienoyl-CoA reductase/sulfur reductase-like enzyme